MLRVRLLFAAPFLALCLVPSARAHHLEPISTRFACPFEPGTGSLQVNYEHERFAREGIGVHLAPVAEFELGLTSHTQFSIEMPLIVETHPGEPATAGAGHLEMSFRYLLAGGERKSYAISINPFVEAPTGNQRLAGDAVAVGLALHFDRDSARAPSSTGITRGRARSADPKSPNACSATTRLSFFRSRAIGTPWSSC